MEARIKMMISVAIFGTIGLFVKHIPLSSGEIALFRALIASAAIFLLQWARGKSIRLPESKRELFLLFASGAAMGFNWILLFEAYRYTTVSIATLSYYFAPVIVAVASPYLYKEKVTGKQIFCFVMSTAGLILVIGVGGPSVTGSHLAGIALGLGAAAFYSVVMLSNKAIRNVTGIDRTLLQFLAAILILVPYVFLTTGIHIGSAPAPGLLTLLIVGLFHTGFTYCLYLSSLKDLRGQEAAILSYIDPLVAIVISVGVLREPIAGTQILGGFMILGFTMLNELGGAVQKQENHR